MAIPAPTIDADLEGVKLPWPVLNQGQGVCAAVRLPGSGGCTTDADVDRLLVGPLAPMNGLSRGVRQNAAAVALVDQACPSPCDLLHPIAACARWQQR